MSLRVSRRPGAVLVAYAFWAVMVGTTLPTPLYVLYQRKLGFSDIVLTAIFAAYAVGVIAALLLLGDLSDRIGRRPMLIAGITASAVSAGLFLAPVSLGFLFAGRVVSGISAGIYTATATATLTDLVPDRARATLVATFANIMGLGTGPILAGALAEWAPDKLRLPYVVSLVLLVPALAGVLAAPETVERRGRFVFSVRRPAVPSEARATFVPAAIAAFAGFAVLGLFTAVAPSLAGKLLHITNHFAAGAIVFAIFAASACTQVVFASVRPGPAMLSGLAGLIAGVLLITGALVWESLGLLIAGALVAGAGQGMSFRGGLASVNQRVPPERRAEASTAYFLVGYVAISLPVVGVGVATELFGLRAAGIAFTLIVAALATGALAATARLERRST